jgi:hypothetical protein
MAALAAQAVKPAQVQAAVPAVRAVPAWAVAAAARGAPAARATDFTLIASHCG